jgi:hypothetical protein
MSPFGKSEPFQGLRFNLWASDLMGRILLFKTDGAVWGGKTCLYLVANRKSPSATWGRYDSWTNTVSRSSLSLSLS